MFQVTIDNFSNENIHRPGNPPEIKKLFIKGQTYSNYVPIFYANGNNETNNGYVSILWEEQTGPFGQNDYSFEVAYIISVVDYEENLRFTQTFSVEGFKTNRIAELGFHRYIARETLLCQSNELLPQDRLTIRIETNWKFYDFPYFHAKSEENLVTCFNCQTAPNELTLMLDSTLGKRLSKESLYFRRMSESPMLEQKTGQWRISNKEYCAFRNIGRIMLGFPYITVDNITSICSLYIVADKYDIPIVIETCRHLFRKHICDGNVDLIETVAQTFNDEILKEIIERFKTDSDFCNIQNERNSAWSVDARLGHKFECISDFEQNPKLDFYS